MLHGEHAPRGYRKVKLTTKLPSWRDLLCLSALAYPWDAIEATLPRAHNPWMRPVADRRTHSVVYKSDDDDKGDEPTGLEKHNFHEIVDVAHPYVPMSPSRRTLVGGGIPLIQVTREIAKHRWDDVTSSCVSTSSTDDSRHGTFRKTRHTAQATLRIRAADPKSNQERSTERFCTLVTGKSFIVSKNV